MVEYLKIIDLFDCFNEVFGLFGWIVVGLVLFVEVMDEVLLFYVEGSIDEVEMVFVEWFIKENIEFFVIF